MNQLNAKIKILEIWKSLNVEGYPLKIATKERSHEVMNMRAMTSNQPIEIGTTAIMQRTCISDAIIIWNNAPSELKDISTIYAMKRATKHYVSTLPM